jgi:hypothetical protein
VHTGGLVVGRRNEERWNGSHRQQTAGGQEKRGVSSEPRRFDAAKQPATLSASCPAGGPVQSQRHEGTPNIRPSPSLPSRAASPAHEEIYPPLSILHFAFCPRAPLPSHPSPPSLLPRPVPQRRHVPTQALPLPVCLASAAPPLNATPYRLRLVGTRQGPSCHVHDTLATATVRCFGNIFMRLCTLWRMPLYVAALALHTGFLSSFASGAPQPGPLCFCFCNRIESRLRSVDPNLENDNGSIHMP